MPHAEAPTASKHKKLIAFRQDQVDALNSITDSTGATFTAAVLEAVDEYIEVRSAGVRDAIKGIMQTDAELFEMLRDA
jgi:hypothetical protein